MANILLKARLALELPPINAALERAAQGLPEPVRPVAQHIFEAGGKRLRPLLTVLTARLLGYEHADIYDLAVTMEMLHAATLLHDDVLDNAASRRGKPAAHTIFEVTPTILAGDALLAEAGSRKERILSATIYLKDIARDKRYWEEKRRRNSGNRGPAPGGHQRRPI